MVLRIGAIASILCVASSSATAAPLSANIAKMDQMIRGAHAEGILVNGTTTPDELVAVHPASKLHCRFLLGLGTLEYFPEQHAILCNMRRSTFTYALSASPVQEGDSLERVEAELRSKLVHGRAAKDIPISEIEREFGNTAGSPPFVASRFQVGRDYWRISAVRSGDWWITSAALSAHPPDLMEMMLQQAEWSALLKDVAGASGP